MGIYRGPGGSTDATRDASSEAAITVEAKDTAVAAATTAQSAASAATVQAANAATSATSAAASLASVGSSVTDAETAQAAAEAAQTAAETAETNAETAQAAAATSATNASNSASSASTSASNAATSATNASNSASAASTSATNASNSATSAATSATNAASSYDAFDDRYLGSKSTAPSTDNDGNPLLTGALYYNTTGTPQLYIWTGSAWDQAAFSVSGAVTSFNTRTGSVTLSSGDVTSALTYTPVNKAVTNTFTATQTFGTVVAETATLTNGTVSTAPSGSTDLVNKSYVDTAVGAAAAGIHFHTPVRVESPTNLPATYSNGTAGVGATLTNSGTQVALVIDGITLSVNDRVLIYAQTNAAHNGVYTVTDVGSGSTNWVLTRATDADSFGEGSNISLDQGSYFFVTSGNTGAGESYVCTTVGTITFGTTAINFTQFSATKEYLAGTGLTLTNATFSITNTGTAGTYGSASTVPVLTTNAQGQVTGVTNTAIAISASSITSGVLPIANGGTGASDAAAARTALGAGDVSLTGTQTLTNKTLTDPAIIGTILEDIFTISDGAAFEIDPGNGSIQLITLGASRTPKATNFANGESVTLMVDDGSAYTLTWTDATFGGTGVVWKTNAGAAPTLNTTGYTVIVLWEVGGQVYGARVGDA